MKSGLGPVVKNRAAHGGEDCAARRVTIKAHALTREARKPFGSRASWILAAIYSRGTYRPTTIDVLMFHFRVRNGTGWGHQAMTTRRLPVKFTCPSDCLFVMCCAVLF